MSWEEHEQANRTIIQYLRGKMYNIPTQTCESNEHILQHHLSN